MQTQSIKPALNALYWGFEYLFALGLIAVGPLWALASVSKLLREPTIGEALWLVLWVVASVPLIWAGRYRWQVLNARRRQ